MREVYKTYHLEELCNQDRVYTKDRWMLEYFISLFKEFNIEDTDQLELILKWNRQMKEDIE